MSLGTFSTDDFQDNLVAWGIFFIGTFVAQIVIFNMLVNLMGKVLDDVLEMKDEYAL